MSRNIHSQTRDAIIMPLVEFKFAVELLLDSPNELRFWSGLGDQTIDGNTYTGAGELLGISEIQESSDLAAYGATVTLSGISPDMVALARSEPYQGRKCNIYFAMKGRQVDGSVDYIQTENWQIAYSGKIDQMTIEAGPETATISVNIESAMIDLRKPRLSRYTHESQQELHAGDLAFEFVTRLQDERLEQGG